jgi:hypothetical protein
MATANPTKDPSEPVGVRKPGVSVCTQSVHKTHRDAQQIPVDDAGGRDPQCDVHINEYSWTSTAMHRQEAQL